jgi:hypothetical protein
MSLASCGRTINILGIYLMFHNASNKPVSMQM